MSSSYLKCKEAAVLGIIIKNYKGSERSPKSEERNECCDQDAGVTEPYTHLGILFATSLAACLRMLL